MQQLQMVFDRIEDTKSKIRNINRMYKDELASNGQYQSAVDQIKTLQAQRKQIERDTKEVMSKAFDELATLKASMQGDKELLADISVSEYAKGGSVKVKKMVRPRKGEPEEVELVPKFSVKFGRV